MSYDQQRYCTFGRRSPHRKAASAPAQHPLSSRRTDSHSRRRHRRRGSHSSVERQLLFRQSVQALHPRTDVSSVVVLHRTTTVRPLPPSSSVQTRCSVPSITSFSFIHLPWTLNPSVHSFVLSFACSIVRSSVLHLTVSFARSFVASSRDQVNRVGNRALVLPYSISPLISPSIKPTISNPCSVRVYAVDPSPFPMQRKTRRLWPNIKASNEYGARVAH